MDEQEKALNDEQAVNSEASAEDEEVKRPSHDDIAAAWDREQATSEQAVEVEEGEVADESEEESTEVVEAPPEPDEEEPSHGEKSRLGRKFKRLEDTLVERDQQINDMRSSIDKLTGHIEALSPNREEEPAIDVDPEQIVTYGDLIKLREQERLQAERDGAEKDDQKKQYEKEYFEALETIEETDGYAEMHELLTGDSEFNRMTTGNARVDFRLNHQAAQLHLLRTSGKKGGPKLKQEKAEGTRVGSPDKVKPKEAKSVNIDALPPDAKDFLDRARARGKDPQAMADRVLGDKR